MTTAQKIAEIEAEMARTQKNKATSGHLGLLKAKLAKLKRELLEPKGGGGGGKGEGFDVSKSGAARVGLIGFPSVGKSTLLSELTGVESKSASYEFTTLTCIPGELKMHGCKIQILDLPGIIEGAKDGKGRGKQVIGVGRSCDLILLCLDASKPSTHKKKIEHELEGFGIRLNKRPPDISIRRNKNSTGGVSISRVGCQLTQLDDKTIKSILREYKIMNAEVVFRCDATADQLIDVCDGKRVYIPCLYVLNKVDSITMEELDLLSKVPNYVMISARGQWNFDELKDKIWKRLDLIRVYTKPKGQIPDYNAPVVLRRKQRTIEDFCRSIHKSMVSQFRYAWVWGSSVKYSPQKCGIDHQLMDEDIVQIVKK